jgi:hypothetical protein
MFATQRRDGRSKLCHRDSRLTRNGSGDRNDVRDAVLRASRLAAIPSVVAAHGLPVRLDDRPIRLQDLVDGIEAARAFACASRRTIR